MNRRPFTRDYCLTTEAKLDSGESPMDKLEPNEQFEEWWYSEGWKIGNKQPIDVAEQRINPLTTKRARETREIYLAGYYQAVTDTKSAFANMVDELKA